MPKKKTTDNKEEFLQMLARMSPQETAEWVRRNGKPPKPVLMYTLLPSKEENSDGS